MDDEKKPLLSHNNEHSVPTVYIRRWYILGCFMCYSLFSNITWSTWGTIADTAITVLCWTKADIALLTNWGCIVNILTGFMLSWIMDVKGLRVSVLMSTAALVLGSGLRCIPVHPSNMLLLIHFGQILIGLGGPVAMAAAPLLSATWFPPHERTTATAIASTTNYLGTAFSFLIGPLIVHDVDHSAGNKTHNKSQSEMILQNHHNCSYEEKNKHHLQEIYNLLYIEAICSVLILIVLFAYFPAKPPKPPSTTAGLKRVDFKSGAKRLMRHTNFWMLAFSFSLSCGVFGSWGTVLDIILKPEISQAETGWIGFYSNLAGTFGGIFFSGLADKAFPGHLKPIVLTLYICAFCLFVWFNLLINHYIPYMKAAVYICCIGSNFVLNAAFPLFFELAVENTYPVAEGITTVFLCWTDNIFASTFLFVLMIPNMATGWMNWCMLGSLGACIPMLFLFRENYSRLDIDVAEENRQASLQAN